MAYIVKNTSALINTRLTDTARLKLSQGNFNISYFQIGDSEISYNTLTGTSYNQSSNNILEPNFNSQNSAQGQTNKQNVKYPIYVDQNDNNTYGIPFSDPAVSPIYNRATMRGFFSGNSSNLSQTWSAYTDTDYVINSNYVVDISTFTGGTKIKIIYSGCNIDIVRLPVKGDLITIFYDGNTTSCGSGPISVTPTSTPTPTPTPSYDACALPLPTPTPSASCCVTTPTGCTPTPVINTFLNVESCYNILTYKIIDVCLDVITLDRVTPNYSYILSGCSYVRTLVYPPNMSDLYDSISPTPHWNPDVINFESICNTDEFDVNVWNMNIPWTENPAGLIDSGGNAAQNYKSFGSKSYIGTKEYLGYMSNSGQTFVDYNGDIEDSVYHYDSFSNKIVVTPKEQKAIAIIHYTNNTIDFFYGEKFALEQPIAGTNPIDVTGDARNFKLHLPWLMWHKNPYSCPNCVGETFYVYPPENLLKIDVNDLFKPHYIKSTKNSDMNMPGIRYYMLWDSNPNAIDGRPNRVGKVFPDQKIIIIDDEELIAALSYKSNRNWTLPAATTSLIIPNSCNSEQSSPLGVLSGTNQTMYVTYLLTNTSSGATNSLHCNYYSTIVGPNVDCGTPGSQNVAVKFGGEFNCLNQITNNTLFSGFIANKFQIICQLVEDGGRPESDGWKIIDFTNQLSATTVNGFLTQSGLTNNTFVITNDLYNPSISNQYNLSNYISLPTVGQTGQTLNFGDEYYFYGTLETDIQATIYEMRYKINLGQAEFQNSSNPSWSQGLPPYISEIGLYDNEMNLMIVSKLQSPVQRQGIQQFLVKFDF
jgi:hypothetical protein